MSKRRKRKKFEYYSWGKDKYDREVWWEKSNWIAHTHHFEIVSDENAFIETLIDPDKVFEDYNFKNKREVFYQFHRFDQGVHSKVIVVSEPEVKHPPSKNPYVLVVTAHQRPNVKEENMLRVKVKFDKGVK